MDKILHERIIHKSYELFLERSLKGVTMDMISSELGISKRTLYEEFPSKAELIKSVFAYRAKEHMQYRFNIISDKQMSSLEKLFELMYINVDQHNREILFIEELGKILPSLIYNEMNQKFDDSIALMSEIIKQGMKEGFFMNNIDSRKITEIYYNLVTSYKVDFGNLHRINRREALVVTSILFYRGLCTPLGAMEIDKLCDKHNVKIF